MSRDQHIVAGIGCAAHADIEAIDAMLASALAELGAAPEALVGLTTIARLRAHSGLIATAFMRAVPLRVFSRDAIAAQQARLLTPSAQVENLAGVPGVAEGAALCVGPLALPKRIGRGCTCALAYLPGTTPFDTLGEVA